MICKGEVTVIMYEERASPLVEMRITLIWLRLLYIKEILDHLRWKSGCRKVTPLSTLYTSTYTQYFSTDGEIDPGREI